MQVQSKWRHCGSVTSVAEYACPVWERSAHAHTLDPERNKACREITGCLKASKVKDLYLLAWIAPLEIRRKWCASVDKKKQESHEAHTLFRQKSAEKHLQSQNCFLRSVHTSEFPAKVVRCSMVTEIEGSTTIQTSAHRWKFSHKTQV